MNKELMYYYQGDVDSSSRNRNDKPSESSSNNNDNEPGKVVQCNCNRLPETIKCKVCGQSFVGRKRVTCQQHRNTIHLMDCAYCVFCKRQL